MTRAVRTHTAFAALSLVFSLAFVGCASVPTALPAEAFVGGGGLYEVDLGSSYLPADTPGSVFDRVYRDREGSIFIGVVVDGPPVPLDDLDASVATNLQKGPYQEARITDVHAAELGGLEARASRIHLIVEGRPFTMINVHTATREQNVQLVVWGMSSRSHLVDQLVKELTGGGFRFLRDALPFGAEAPNLADLPVKFDILDQGWRTAPKGQLNEEAVVELIHPDGRYLIAMIEQVGEVPFDAMRSVLQENLSGLLSPPGDGTTAPYAEQGDVGDARWTQSGLLNGEDGISVTYRVRLLEDGGQFLHLYCWGDSGQQDLVEACDKLLEGAALKP